MDKFFAKSIVISLIVHFAAVGSGQFANFGKIPKSSVLKQLQVNYCQLNPVKNEISNGVKEPPKLVKRSLPLKVEKQVQAIETKKASQDKLQERDKIEEVKRAPKTTEELPKAPPEPLGEKITPKNEFVKLQGGGSIRTDPAYLSYYQMIREKIREHAFYNYKQHSQEGQVYINFTISRDGSLLSVKVDNKRSDDNGYLKDVAKRSVAQASPYPAFPDELREPQIAFNVIISFSAGRLSLSRQ